MTGNPPTGGNIKGGTKGPGLKDQCASSFFLGGPRGNQDPGKKKSSSGKSQTFRQEAISLMDQGKFHPGKRRKLAIVHLVDEKKNMRVQKKAIFLSGQEIAGLRLVSDQRLYDGGKSEDLWPSSAVFRKGKEGPS